jgi:hypothetical protein
LTEVLSWRAVLVVPALLAAAVGIAAHIVLEADGRRRPKQALDLPGGVAMTLAIGLLLYGLSTSGVKGWASPSTLGAIGLGIGMAATFVTLERRSSASSVSSSRLPYRPSLARGGLHSPTIRFPAVPPSRRAARARSARHACEW